ncbi:SGNH/GDSL hydrolase family protein [Phytoactinopolyspora limicola]|uniref:SGNH/GDSL hydrolase family protein n=1 Tax=Phytoactinopolyspora limicola TaxID=2715536 RepID=UPI0014086705|nr:SGNH/GDSL hydrolase family protein [Phytoactinopolyspora limicola]
MTPHYQEIRADADVLDWAGTVDVEHTADWSRGWRLPVDRLDLFPSGPLRTRATHQAGIRVVVETDASAVSARAIPPDSDKQLYVDVVIAGEIVASLPVGGDGSLPEAELPSGHKRVELWLPQTDDFRLASVHLPVGATVAKPEPSKRRRIIAYGSSITQCAAAASPARTWPAIVARAHDLDLLCLGFGGQCQMDPMIGRLIRDEPADVIVTCLGINIYGAGTFNRRSLLPNILGLISTIRDGHPGTPMVVMSPVVSPSRESLVGKTEMTLSEVRGQVHEAAELLQRFGDGDLHYVDGLDVLGESDAHLLSDDGLHPGPEGYEHIGQSLVPIVKGLLP